MKRLTVCSATTLLLLAACGEDGTGGTESATSSETADPDESESTNDASSTGVATSGSDSETAGMEDPPEPLLARGVTMPRFVADQGVAVPIGLDGVGVGGEGRNAHLIANRRMLVRGFADVLDESGWTPRELRATLILKYADGTEEAADKTVLVEKDSEEKYYNTTFNWIIPAELIKSGMHFEAALYETTQELAGTDEPDPAPIFPIDGKKAYVGVEDSYMKLKVALVPIKHDLDGKNCADAPDLNEQVVQRLHDELLMQNPVDEVLLEVLPEFVYTSPMTSFSPLLSALSQARADFGVGPEVYVYGLTVPCDGGADGVGGQAIGIPQAPTKSNSLQRVAMGRFYGSLSSTAGTFVHEVGHTQGRFHILCSGEEGGPDNSYPYPGGDIGVFGFGILDFVLHPPTNHDYMTYCGQTWVSDWGWEKVYPVIQTLSSWDFDDEGDVPDGTLLVGALYPDGSEEWWTAPGNLEGEVTSAVHSLELHAGESVLVAPVSYSKRPHDETYNVIAELPVSLDAVSAIERVGEGGARFPVAVPSIKRIAAEPQ